MIRSLSVRRARLVAVTELRRTRRKAFSWSLKSLVLLALVPVVLLGYSAGLGLFAYFLGPDLVAGTIPPRYPRAAAAGVVALVAFFVGQRTVKRTGRIDEAAAILTAIPARDALVGVVLAEVGRATAVAAIPAATTALGLAIGVGIPLVAVSGTAVGLSLVLLGVALGFVVGLAVKNVAVRSSLVANHRTAIGIAATVVFFSTYLVLSSDPAVTGPAVRIAGRLPTGWLVDLALLPAGAGDPLLAAAGVGAVVLAVPALLAVAVRLATWLWFADRARPDERSRESSASGSGAVERVLAPRIGRTTVRVARKSWRRAARAPFTVQYAVVPFFTLFTPLQQTIATGQVPEYLPAMLVLAAAWATGAAFTLNPIGGEGAVLPVVLAADVDGRQFVGGLALAGIAAGIPLSVALATAAGVLAGTPIGLLAGWILVGVGLCLATPAVAAAVGVAFPKFETTNVGSNRQAIVPSVWAFGLYSVAVGVVALPSLAAVGPGVLDGLADLVGISPVALAAGGFAATAVLAIVFGATGAWIAVRRFEGYRLA